VPSGSLTILHNLPGSSNNTAYLLEILTTTTTIPTPQFIQTTSSLIFRWIFSVGSDSPTIASKVRFKVLTAASKKMPVFWVVAIRHCPDDGGSNHLWNVCELLPDYTAQTTASHLHNRRRENLKFHKIFQIVYIKLIIFIIYARKIKYLERLPCCYLLISGRDTGNLTEIAYLLFKVFRQIKDPTATATGCSVVLTSPRHCRLVLFTAVSWNVIKCDDLQLHANNIY
jgi:hypothetical protein